MLIELILIIFLIFWVYYPGFISKPKNSDIQQEVVENPVPKEIKETKDINTIFTSEDVENMKKTLGQLRRGIF